MTKPTKPTKRAPDAKSDADDTTARIATFRAPTDKERVTIEAAKVRNAERPARLAVKSERKSEGVSQVWPVHSDGEGFGAMTRDTFGTSSNAFCDAAMTRLDPILRDQGSKDAAPDSRMNAALAVMGAVAPTNEIEAIIGEQVVAAHVLSMDLMGKSHHADTIPKMEAYVNMATKLSRTMAAQLETLSKLRTGGKQQVEVRHVYVDARGSQNAFALGAGGYGGAGAAKPGQPHVPGRPFAPGVPVWSEDQSGDAMQATGDAREEALPAPRWEEPRCAEGQGKRAVSNGPSHSGDGPGPADGPGARERGS